MVYRSKAPLRIGLAGGGTDVSPYCDLYGGAILNATISLFAHAHIETIDRPMIELVAAETRDALKGVEVEVPAHRSTQLRDEHVDAAAVAAKVGMPPEQVFKTLVARGDRNGV